MAKSEIKCDQCGKAFMKRNGCINRSRRLGKPMFCSTACMWNHRGRDTRTADQKRADKAAYDREYRAKNREMLKAKKANYHKRTYDPVAAAEHRRTRMAAHVEYCRQPKYKAWKREYDRKYRANREYGPLADAFLALQDLQDEIDNRATDYEVRKSNGTLNKKQTRRRAYEQANR